MRVIVIIVLLVSSAALACAVDITDDPMMIGGGARPLGMGRAFTAVVDDADAMFLNPAGAANMRGMQAMSMFTNLLGEIYYVELCGGIPTLYGTFGAGYVATGINNVLYPSGGPGNVYADYYDHLFVLSYGAPLSLFLTYARNVYIGTNLKLFNRGWSGGVNEAATGVSADLGVKVIVSPGLSLGLCRQNLLPVNMGGVLVWPTGAAEAIAGIYRLGVAVRPYLGKTLLTCDLHLPAYSNRPGTGHLGVEYTVSENMLLRAGADQSVDASSPDRTSWNPTLGLSLGLRGFRFDYTYHPYYNDPMLATQYISISYQGDNSSILSGGVQ
jgi:hypothetical protein